LLHLTEEQWKRKVEAWFFRNLLTEQRQKLFDMFEFPDLETQHEQRRLFRYIFRDWWCFKERQPAESVCVEVAHFDKDVGEWIHEIILTPSGIKPEHTHWRYLRAPE